MSIKWISLVWSDSPYQGDRLLLHLALADFANDEGECWPSQRTLARKARCSERWVRESIAAMVADGLIEIKAQRIGRGGRTLYLLKRGSQFPLSEESGTTEQEKRNSGASLPIKNRHEPSLVDAWNEQFAQFWQAYPRKVAKGAALREWARIGKSQTAPSIGDLLRAIERYRTSVSDPRFICHPATWLRQERWSDEIAAPDTPTPSRAGPSKFRVAESFAAGLKRAGRSREQVAEALEGRSPEEIAAGLATFDAL